MVEVTGYEMHERIGSGGVGDVYRATQTSTGANVAVKVVRQIEDADGTWRRIERELRALVELVGHANVVGVVEMVPTDGGRALVMEYATGGSLADRVERDGPLSVEQTVLVGRQIASAVSAAHERGIVHRDIKPQNVLIDGYGQAKLCDFGIASLLRSAELKDRTSAISMRYASPEDVEDEGDLVGPPSDVYSLGATLLFLRRGAPPTTLERVSGWVPTGDATDPAASELDGIIADLLAVNPYTRPTMRVVLERLTALDRRLPAAVDGLFGEEAELFPPSTEPDPELLFPNPGADLRSSGGFETQGGFDAPALPVSPRKLRPGTRTIGVMSSNRQRSTFPAAERGAPVAELPMEAEVVGGPSEEALTAAFGPLDDVGQAPARSEEISRFWEDETAHRDDPPRPQAKVTPPTDTPRRRRWPAIALVVFGVVAVVGVVAWQSRNPSPVAAPTIPTTAATTVVASVAATTAVPESSAATSAATTSVAPRNDTSAATTEPVPTTLAPGTVPAEPRPTGLSDLAAIERPEVPAGTCLVQVATTLEVLSCEQPHDLELLASVEAEDAGSIRVTDATIRKTGSLLCSNRFIELVHGNNGETALQSALTLEATTPDVAGWDSGDRTVDCWVLVPGQRLRGSAVGSGW